MTEALLTFDSSTILSSHFTLENLIVTNQLLALPNSPSSQSEMDNLTFLADVLEQINLEVGPFQILSGFRSPELQAVLTAQGEPTSPGLSFHQVGRAADITPTNMTLLAMFGKILSSESLRSRLAEIAYKPGQNSLHFAVNVPDDTRNTKVLALNSQNVYGRLTPEEISTYVAPFVKAEELTATVENISSAGISKFSMIAIVATVLGIFSSFLIRKDD